MNDVDNLNEKPFSMQRGWEASLIEFQKPLEVYIDDQRSQALRW